jgi:hypothetical protein
MKRLETIAFVLLLLVAGQLYAQPVAPEPAAPATAPTAVTTATEIRAQVEKADIQVKADQQTVLYLQAVARKEKDVIKLSCVNDKMVLLKAQANLFDQSRAELTAVMETDARDGVFRSVVDTAERIRKIREEAEGCIGQPELGNEFASDFTAPAIPDDPTTGVPFDNNDSVIEPPAYASPFN